MRKSEVEELDRRLTNNRIHLEEAIRTLEISYRELEEILAKLSSDKKFMEMNDSGKLRCRNNTVERPIEFALQTLNTIKKKRVIDDVKELSTGYICMILGVLTYLDSMPKKRFGIF